MKNFSAKTADFDNISIDGEAPVVQSDIGTAPNQIPLNQDLGSLAYMDSSGAEFDLSQISTEITGTAVDVFVYDTSKDSDGGAWRTQTQNTSWYNEKLNTATRGGRREFPAVAVIVAEADKVTIYDGDDPDLGMWMVFEATFNMNLITATTGTTISSLSALNGVVCVGVNGSSPHLTPIDFISEKSGHYTTAGNKYFLFDISKRNNISNPAHGSYDSTVAIVDSAVNGVAMTVLPNAPINSETGLPVPTIAVATDGGVSVIKDNGSVVDYTCTYSSNNKYSLINFIGGSKLLACSRDGKTYPTVFNIPSQDKNSFDLTDIVFAANPSDSSSAADIRVGNYSDYEASAVTKENIAMGGSGLIISNIDNVSGDQTADNVIISSSYNTGWMPGDIKLATLSDSIEGEAEILNNAEDWTGSDTNTEPTGWLEETADSTTFSVSNGELTLSQTGAANSKIYQAFNVTQGQLYRFEIRFKANSGTARYQVADNPNASGGAIVPSRNYTGSTYIVESVEFTAVNTTQYSIAISCYGGGGSATFDYVRLIEVETVGEGELITNGTFDDGIEGWDDNSLGTGSVVYDSGTGTVKLTRIDGSNNGVLAQGMSLLAGKRYVLSFDTGSIVTSSIQIRGYTSSTTTTGSIIENSLVISANSSFITTFVAKAEEDGLEFRAVSGTNTYIYLDNISVRLVEEDRSVNDNGLQIFGEIKKTPVAHGSDLVAYSGFSADNYLMQPYNPDLDFGTGDFCMMAWIKDFEINGDYQRIFSRGVDGSTGVEWDLYFHVSTPNFRLRYYVDGVNMGDTYLALGLGSDIHANTWNQIIFLRKDGVVKVYINGSGTGYVGELLPVDLTNTNARLCIGNRFVPSDSSSFNGSIALTRISTTVPTDAQIAKIYRDEKVLFQDGAQATLYGTSDAVTALAHDDSEDLLHVGTANGRSSFNGLKRVDNTTTAVSTAISATEGLVIEQ